MSSWKGSWGGAAAGGNQWGAAAPSWGAPAGNSFGGKAAGGKGAAGGKAAVSNGAWGAATKVDAWTKPAVQQSWNTPAGKGAPAKGAGKGAAAGVDTAALGVALKAKVAKLTTDVKCGETVTTTTLDASKIVYDNEKATAGSLKASMDSLDKQSTKLKDISEQIIAACDEARKSGPANIAQAQELAKLLVKTKGIMQQLNLQSNKLKPRQMKAAAELENKVKEAKDTAAFKAVLAKAKSELNAVEVAVNAVARQAAPVLNKPPEGDALDTKIANIEKAATDASAKHDATRTSLNENLKTIQAYAPEARKAAHLSLQELQKKLTDLVKVCLVYKDFKRQMPKIVENQKVVTEVTDKLIGHDTAIAKASKLGDKVKVSKEDVKSIDEALEPVQKAITEAISAIVQKSRQADAVSASKLNAQKTKADELKKKIDAVITKIKAQKDKHRAEEAEGQAQEKLEAAEAGYTQCQDAEMPFLTGVEVLPEGEMEEAIKGCNEACTTASQALLAGKTFVQQRLAEARGYEKELSESTVAALQPIQKKLADIEQKVAKFRKETSERKMAAILIGASDAVEAFEKKCKAADKDGKPLASKTLEEDDVAAIQEAIEKSKTAQAEATTLGNEARKVIATKQREGKVTHNNPALAKLQTQLNSSLEKLNAIRNHVSSAERLVKAKQAVALGEEKAKEAEAEAAKAQKLVPAEGKKITVEQVKALDEAIVVAMKAINLAGSTVQAHLVAAPAKTKAEIQAILDRKTAAKAIVDKVKLDTKAVREEALSSSFISEAEDLVKAAEEAAAKMDQAEGPFLVGKTMDLKTTTELLEKCTEAGKAVTTTMTAAKAFQATKNREVGAFGEASRTAVKEGFAGLAERLTATASKLVTFEKDLRSRSKASRMVEAGEKVDQLEADVKKLVTAAEPFTKEGADKMTEAEAAAPLQIFMDAQKEAAKNLGECRRFLGERIKEQKDSKEESEACKKLQERLTKANEDMAPGKKAAAPHEQRSLGTRLLAEAKVQVGALDAEVKKATTASAPLLEQGGVDFLVGVSMRTLAVALQAHMKAKDLDQDALFKEVAAGKAANEKAFVKYLTALAEAIEHDELNAFTEERRVAIFKRLASNGKAVSAADFKGLFEQNYICIKATAVTSKFEVDEDAVVKIDLNTEVVLVGSPKEDAEKGLHRCECKVDGKSGWITVRQNKGATFLKLSSPFLTFSAVVDKAIADAGTAIQEASKSLAMKMRQGGDAKEGPLKEARDEMGKLREDANKASKALDELRKNLSAARQKYATTERTEKNAHIEARNAKEAAAFVEEPAAKAAEAEALATAAEEAAAPLVSLSGDELLAFATPASVVEKVEKAAASTVEKCKEAKESLLAQTKAVKEATPQTGGTAEAQKQLKALHLRVDEASKKSNKAMVVARGKSRSIVDPKMAPTGDALRKHAQSKKLSGEQLFDSLKDGDKIPEAAFCKLVGALGDDALKGEIATLVCRKLEADGISKDRFLNFVNLYYKVVKSIAFTDNQDITKCKTLRKADENEVLEVLEGPVEDEANGLTRIRARSFAEPHTEGWVTLSGSKGSVFLAKTMKPKAPVAKAA